MTTASDLVIGVDGGGTKTLAFIAPLDDDSNTVVLGRGGAGPGNPRAVGFDAAQANIALAIETAFGDARLPRSSAAAACFCLAGAGREVEQQQIAAWAKEQQMARLVRVSGDAEPILAAASPNNEGIALICGTGSLAWGRNREGQTARSGGWGYLLGDEGSGYAIALAGLRAAVQAADKRAEPTDLLPAFMGKLGANSPQELVAKVYGPEMNRERLAELASVVFDLRTTDAVAQRIIQSAANELAEMVTAVAAELRLPPQRYTLAMAGGVLLYQLNYIDEVVSQLNHSSKASPEKWTLVHLPVAGAVALARSRAK
ncbi:MAG: N-acetylglucosamine kinase, partial [Planctomycetia bacterium]|nr:N-acetylglucosamine kinase [Planctomycetia bacterium]